jgi:plastocyanin
LRWTIALAALGIAVLGVAAFSIASGGSARAATTQVNVGNYYFCAQADSGSVCETDITAGDAITWNVSTGTHHVVQCAEASFSACPPAGGFDGGQFSSGQFFSHTFATAGTYFYHCAIHPSEMMGKIVVAAAATASPTAAPTAVATVAPTSTAATEAPTTAPTVAALPKTGGATTDSRASAWQYVLLASGMALLGAAVVAFAAARKK